MHDWERQLAVDEEHLRLIRLGYFVNAATAGFYSFFGLLYSGIAFFFVRALPYLPASPSPKSVSPSFSQQAFVGSLVLLGVGAVMLGFTIAALRLRAAKCIRERRSRLFCQLIAATSCIELPYGTVFSVLALTALSRPSVRSLFHDENR